MTRSNRLLNRLLLLVVGAALLVAAAWIGLRADALAPLGPIDVPDIPALDATAWWVAAATAALVAVLAVAWAASRGRGAVRDLHVADGLVISSDVATDMLRSALRRTPDVGPVSTRAYLVRGRRALLVRVHAVAGEKLPRLLDAARAAVRDLDTQLEQQVPLVLHITTTSRVIPTRDRRVD